MIRIDDSLEMYFKRICMLVFTSSHNFNYVYETDKKIEKEN